jgi:hypothetical protein
MKNIQKIQSDLLARKPSPALLSLVSALVVLWVAHAAAQAIEPVTNAVAADVAKAASPSNPPPAVVLSAGITEILKLADAGVSTEVITTYIETSPLKLQPTEQDVIALKKHNVPDEVVNLLLKRGAQARDIATQVRNEAILQIIESRRAASGGIDPESHDYFRAYYLQPRAVAAANQRLYPYSGPYSVGGYAYGPAFNYGGPLLARPAYRGYR